ncbi:hypothetical protein VitviT2T_015780 [Vitis vinifera]|uniref:Uncharacterized protein n=1 Tax=Vitis vinifera TaxID=29760 RepID=A0ABY9CRK7_VITVI|nr:hypothetical protein VitviT2T_015780 [Vitis vinifera]
MKPNSPQRHFAKRPKIACDINHSSQAEVLIPLQQDSTSKGMNYNTQQADRYATSLRNELRLMTSTVFAKQDDVTPQNIKRALIYAET